MGLDIVEMVMRVEEEFGIDIPDEIAATFTTPRTIIDYLTDLPQFEAENRPREYIADKVWAIIEDETANRRSDYNEDSRFIEDMGMD
ncbi:MAG: phosphopantetheine-binding protein [Pyrinomonadaceae bacterium]